MNIEFPCPAARSLERGLNLLVGMLMLWLSTLTSQAATNIVTLQTETAILQIDSGGRLTAITRKETGRSYLAPGQPAPILSIRAAGTMVSPTSATWDPPRRNLDLHYGAGVDAVVRVEAHPAYVSFSVTEVKPVGKVELIVWGPYPTTIGETIGETVGVVSDREFAVGIQALNVKTLGGFPKFENDAEAESSGDDHGIYPDLSAELLTGQGYRGDTAQRTGFGSVLQAYCRNRDTERVVPNWGHPQYRVLPFNDGGVLGSRIALFACPNDQTLPTISAIEVAEGLPHPMIDGVWGKISPGATASYLIVDFSEENIDRAIEMTRRAGLKYLYHSSPFETWGHFRLKPNLFPHGWDGLRTCVEKARQAGIRVGVHSLSNFITPNDPYVAPSPDPRLAVIGSSPLVEDIDATQREIPVQVPDYFTKKSAMNTVRIGDELIRFGSVSTNAPWQLLDCRRGAWGTRADRHSKDQPVARLLDHDYKVFLSDADLSQEIARNLADLFNQTGLLQTSFDGLEGNWSTGYGKYGCALFVKAWFDALLPELQGRVINDASLPGHFNWHINTRMNWGEPWYASFRESQTLYRFRNQVYFERNLMPRMLGWFALRPDTSIEDAEWLLARAAGFNAGFALATSLASTAQLAADPSSVEAARRFGGTPVILEAVKQWETARMSGAFPAKVRSALRDNSREFHLEASPKGGWNLQEAHPLRLTHDASKAEATTFRFESPRPGQSLQWIIRDVGKEPVPGLRIQINGQSVVDLANHSLPAGGSLKYSGGREAVLADAHWNEIDRVRLQNDPIQSGTTESSIKIDCAPTPGASLKVELRILDPTIPIRQVGPN